MSDLYVCVFLCVCGYVCMSVSKCLSIDVSVCVSMCVSVSFVLIFLDLVIKTSPVEKPLHNFEKINKERKQNESM